MIHLARLLIVISSLFLARPLWEGGWRYYLDHSAHIAETIDLGRNSSGWSDLAFAGFPLGFLHSPLWYGIAARLVALGVPGWVNHLFWTVFGHAVIGLCALEVARRLAPLPVALLAAWLAQNQSLLITGPSGVFSGMWTFGISIGLVLLLFKELHAPLGWAALPKLALLIGLIGLTHTFAIHAIVVLVGMRCLMLVVTRPLYFRGILVIACASLLGALASAHYWLTAALLFDRRDVYPVLYPGLVNAQIFFRPFLEANYDLGRILLEGSVELPDLLLIFLAASSIVFLPRCSEEELKEWVLSWAFAIFVVAFLSRAALWPNNRWLGPIPWRILIFPRTLLVVPVALCLAKALPEKGFKHHLHWVALAFVLFAGGSWIKGRAEFFEREIGLHRKDEVDPQLEGLFKWFAERASMIRGRVYVQNTFGSLPLPLGGGHALAILPIRAGVHAVGSYYSLVPLGTDTWLSAFVGPFVGTAVTNEKRALIDQRLNDLAAEVVVAVDQETINALSRWAPQYRVIAEFPPFVVIERPFPGWVRSSDPRVLVKWIGYKDGVIEFDVQGAAQAHEVSVAVAFSPGWRLERGPREAEITRRPNALIGVRLPPGDHRIRLRFQAPSWPTWMSGFAWAVIAMLFFLGPRPWLGHMIAKERLLTPKKGGTVG